MANKSFVMYDSWTEMVEDLTDEEAGRLLKAIYAYRQDRTHKPDDRSLRPVFNILKQRFEEDDEAYQEKVAKRAEASRKANGIKRKQSESNGVNRSQSESNGANRNQMETDTDTEFDTDTDTVTDTESDKDLKKKPSRAAFVKPTLEEIKAYCKERKNNVDPEAFMDFYASKGWKVGNQSMKDWKAAVRTWEKREKPKEKPPDPWKMSNQRNYDYDAIEKQLLGWGN